MDSSLAKDSVLIIVFLFFFWGLGGGGGGEAVHDGHHILGVADQMLSHDGIHERCLVSVDREQSGCSQEDAHASPLPSCAVHHASPLLNFIQFFFLNFIPTRRI